MITDNQTNYVYLADTLKERHEKFFNELTEILNKHNIKYDILKGTKDIWCRDYMPIQVSESKFVQFVYEPGYLKAEKYRDIKTDSHLITQNIGIDNIMTDIKVDGGNVIRLKNKVILTDKIYFENPDWNKESLVKEIAKLLEVDEVIIIPHEPEPYDYLGHSDGMVRFIDKDRVIINEFIGAPEPYQKKLKQILTNHHLEVLEIPYERCDEKNDEGEYTAKGYYINYLHVGHLIILPSFGFSKDNLSKAKISSLFPEHKIETIDCNEIAYKGGVLNCVSWNIFKT